MLVTLHASSKLCKDQKKKEVDLVLGQLYLKRLFTLHPNHITIRDTIGMHSYFSPIEELMILHASNKLYEDHEEC